MLNKSSLRKYISIVWKSMLEFIPIFTFVISFKLTDNFYTATYVLIFTTCLYTFYTFHKQKRIPFLPLFLTLETSLFGFATIVFKNPDILQVRDTLYDLVLGTVIFVSAKLDHPITRKFFGHLFDLELTHWRSISYQWSAIMFFFASCNEYMRRNFSEEVWVNYKTFVIVVTFIFCFYLLFKYKKYDKSLGL